MGSAGGGLDVMTKNQGEVVRKVHARELAANVVVALFRLVKLSTLHSLDNQAMVRQVEETVHLIAEYGQRTDHNISILFAHGSVFVGGQLLRANRGVYEGALELGQVLAKVGAAEIGIRREAQPSDFYSFASVLADALRKPKPPKVDRPSPNIRLRGLASAAMLRENLASERVDPGIQVARTYASAVVIMRRFFLELRAGRYDLPQRVKRVAQRLVDLSGGETPAFLGVTAARNQNHDEAGRAVNTAILALAMTRQISTDLVQLSRMAMAALLYDCARARISGAVGGGGGIMIMPTYSEQQELEAPAGTAVVLTALGRINEPSVMRTVISYEAHWEKRRARLGPVYRGLRAASLQARIVHIARAFNDLLTPGAVATPPTADEAIAKLELEASDAADRTVIRLLIGALGIFTTGTIVKLNSGETGLVVQTGAHPSLYSQPRVRLVMDGAGGWLQPPVEIDLAHQRKGRGETTRHIKEVLATSDDPAGAQLRAYAAGPTAMSGVRMQNGYGPSPSPSSYPSAPGPSDPPSYQNTPPSHQNNPASYQNNPPSYQNTPPSYQTNPASGQLGPPSYQVTPPSFQNAPAQGQYTPQPQYSPQPPQQQYVQAPTPAPSVQYARALTTPAPKGRASTLTSPVFETAEPAPSVRGRNPAFYGDRFEHAPPLPSSPPPELEPLEELVEDEEPEAAGWEEQPELLEAPADEIEEEATHALDEPEPQAAPAQALGSASASSGRSMTDAPPRGAPTAEGSLAKTPFVHLLIYMLDLRLSGTTVFTLPNGTSHSVYFMEGTPAKVRTGGMIEPLDRVLVDLGLLDEATLRGTLMEVSKKHVLHGRLLVMKGLLTRETVISALRAQVLRKVTHLFELAGDVRYAYYKDENLLTAFGGPELTPTEPLATIMAGVRLMAGDPLVDATLTKIQGRPLALHIDAEMKRFQLTREEESVVDVMRTRKMTIREIVLANVAQERVVRLTVYALVVTRHLDLGVAAKPPVGLGPRPADATEARPEPAPAPAPATPAPAPARARPEAGRRSDPVVQERASARPNARTHTITGQPPSVAPPPVTAQRAGRSSAEPPPSSQNTPQPISPWGGQPPSSPSGQARPSMPPVNLPADASPASRPGARAPRPPQPSAPPQQQYAPPPQQQYAPPQQPQYAPPPQQQYAPPQQQFAPLQAAPPQQPQFAPLQAAPPQQQYAPQPVAAPPPPAQRVSPPAPSPAAAPPMRPEMAARRADIEARAQKIDGEDYFQMLGVDGAATPDQIKAAYFGLAKSWHPDRLPAELLEVKPQVARVFARFSEAYQTLMDPAKNKDYQQIIKQGGGSPDDQEKVARVVDAALEFQKAEILLKKNDVAGAEQLASRAVAADPDQPEYLTLLVWIRAMRRGDPPELREGQTSTHYDDLIKALDGVLLKEKEYERALYYRGVLLKRSGRGEKAMRDFRLSAQLNPKNLDAVREVRLFEMRKRGGAPAPGAPAKGAGDQPEGGLFGKFFKR